jgi:hypothetical protein
MKTERKRGKNKSKRERKMGGKKRTNKSTTIAKNKISVLQQLAVHTVLNNFETSQNQYVSFKHGMDGYATCY